MGVAVLGGPLSSLWRNPCGEKLRPPANMYMYFSQSRLTLCDPTNCSSQAPLSMGILQARILEWVTTPFSR